MKENQELLICECHNIEHQIFIEYDKIDNVAYFEYHLAPLPFFKRLWHAIQYICGKRSRYGEFGEIIIGDSYADYFIDLGTRLKNGKPSNI